MNQVNGRRIAAGEIEASRIGIIEVCVPVLRAATSEQRSDQG